MRKAIKHNQQVPSADEMSRAEVKMDSECHFNENAVNGLASACGALF